MDVDNISVKLDLDLKSYLTGLKTASTAAKKTASDIQKLNTTIKLKVDVDQTKLNALKQTFSQIRQDADRGATFKLRVDTSGTQGVKQVMQDLRSDASNGATFALKADTSGTQGVKSVLSDLRADASNGATFVLKADASGVNGIKTTLADLRSDASNGATFKLNGDASGTNGIKTTLSDLRSDASNGATFKIIADLSGITGASSELQSLRSDASNGATMNIDADTSGLALAASEVESLIAITSTADDTIHIQADFDGAAATAGVASLTSALSSGGSAASVFNRSFIPISGQMGIAAVAFVGLASAITPALGGLTALAGIGASAAGGFGLVAAAAVGLGSDLTSLSEANKKVEDATTKVAIQEERLRQAYASGDEADIKDARKELSDATEALTEAEIGLNLETAKHGEAIATLFQKYQDFKSAAADAFEPAKIALAELSTSVLDFAQSRLPLLGSTATTVMSEFSTAIEGVMAQLDEPIEQANFFAVLQTMPSVVGNLTTAAGDAFAGVINILGTAAPYGERLSEAIANVAEGFRSWTESEEGRQKLTEWMDSASETLGIIWDSAVKIGGALENFSSEHPDELNKSLTAIRDMILLIIEATDKAVTAFELLDKTVATENEWTTNIREKLGFESKGEDTLKEKIGQAQSDLESNAGGSTTGWSQLLGGLGDIRVWLDENVKKPINSWLANWVPETTLWKVLTGDMEGEETANGASQIISGLQSAYDSVTEWFAGLAPPITLMDVFTGDATVQEAADSGNFAAGLITKLQSAYDGVITWFDGLAPPKTLWDVLMGDATLEEAADSGNASASLITKLQGAYDGALEWFDGLAPPVTLWDVLMGDATLEEAADSGNASAGLITKLQGAYDEAVAWFDGLAPPKTLWDVLMGDATMQEAADSGNPAAGLIVKLQGAWDSAMEWLGGLVPDKTLGEIIMGGVEGIGAKFEEIKSDLESRLSDITERFQSKYEEWKGKAGEFFTSLKAEYWDKYFGEGGLLSTPVDEFFTGLVSKYWTPYFGEGGLLRQPVSDFFTWLVDTYWTPYFGEGGSLRQPIEDFFTWVVETFWTPYFGEGGLLRQPISDFFTWLVDTYWTPYFGEGGLLRQPIADFFTYIVDTYWTPYFGEGGLLRQPVADFFTYIVDTYWTPYFGEGGYLRQPISDFFTYIVDTYWTPYFGEGGYLRQPIADFFTYIVDTYWTPYFGEGGYLRQPIEDFFTWLVDTYWTPYFGTEGSLVTSVQEAWDAILSGTEEFVKGWYNTLGQGIADGINAAIGFLNGLIDAIDTVLTAINVTTIGVDVEEVSFSPMEEGGVVGMAKGGGRGGKGTNANKPQHIVWNEQQGREWWIATSGPREANVGYLAGAAQDMGYGIVPMAQGGSMGAPVWGMAIGGGTDLGPGGLTGLAAEIADTIMKEYGVWANTYTGEGIGEHGGYGYQFGHENTFDFWSDSGFSALDVGTGDAILAEIHEKWHSQLATTIWQGKGENPDGGFYDDDHYDHLHVGVGGEGGLNNTAGVIAQALFSAAKIAWDAAISLLGTPDFGDGALWDGIEEYIGEIPSKAWSWLLSWIPTGFGGGSSGGIGELSGDIQSMLSQGINAAGWDAQDLTDLVELWGHESGFDPNIVNPDSGAYGIPQINPSSWGTPAPLGDAAAQIEWGIDYIKDRYGDATAALDHWWSEGWYEEGGVIGGAEAMAGGGTRPNRGVGRQTRPNYNSPMQAFNNMREASRAGNLVDEDGMLLGGLLGMAKGGKAGNQNRNQNRNQKQNQNRNRPAKANQRQAPHRGNAGQNKKQDKSHQKAQQKKAEKKAREQRRKDKGGLQKKKDRDKGKGKGKGPRLSAEETKACTMCSATDTSSTNGSTSGINTSTTTINQGNVGGRQSGSMNQSSSNKPSSAGSSSGKKRRSSSLPSGAERTQIQRKTKERGGNQQSNIDLIRNTTNMARGGKVSSPSSTQNKSYTGSGFWSDTQTTGAGKNPRSTTSGNKPKRSSSSTSGSSGGSNAGGISDSFSTPGQSDSTSTTSSTGGGAKTRRLERQKKKACRHCEKAKRREERRARKEKAKEDKQDPTTPDTPPDTPTPTPDTPTSPSASSSGGGNIQSAAARAAVLRSAIPAYIRDATDLGFKKGGCTNCRGEKYHRGGVIPGRGEKSLIAEAGERVLPKSLNRGFERLAKALHKWDRQQQSSPGSGAQTFSTDAKENRLEKVIATLERGQREPTPVTVNNSKEIGKEGAKIAFAAVQSDLGKEIMDEGIAEGLGFYIGMGTEVT